VQILKRILGEPLDVIVRKALLQADDFGDRSGWIIHRDGHAIARVTQVCAADYPWKVGRVEWFGTEPGDAGSLAFWAKVRFQSIACGWVDEFALMSEPLHGGDQLAMRGPLNAMGTCRRSRIAISAVRVCLPV